MFTFVKSRHALRLVSAFNPMRQFPVKKLSFSLVGLMVFWMLAIPAKADLTTFNVSFSANSFQVGSGGDPPPVDPVVGSFRVTLDPGVAVSNSTAGITLLSLNIVLGSPISFTYDPNADGSFPPGTLRVGGIANGTDVINFNPSTDDFWLFINDFTGTPAFQQLGYTQTSVSNNNLFFTINQTGSVNVSVVPEPSSFFALGVGLAWIGMLRRKRSP